MAPVAKFVKKNPLVTAVAVGALTGGIGYAAYASTGALSVGGLSYGSIATTGALVGGAVGGAAVLAKNALTTPGVKTPTATADDASTTAAPVALFNEAEKKNQRLAAAVAMKDYSNQPKLATQGLLAW